jgi:hypothetical protein
VLVRAVLMPRSLRKFGLYRFFLVNPRPAHLFMICSIIRLTGPVESIGIDPREIHEQNQRDSTMDVQFKLDHAKGYSGYLAFRSVRGAREDAEQCFDENSALMRSCVRPGGIECPTEK